MKEKKYSAGKGLSVLCVFAAVLLGLLSAAAWADDPLPEEEADQPGIYEAAEWTHAETVETPEEQPLAPDAGNDVEPAAEAEESPEEINELPDDCEPIPDDPGQTPEEPGENPDHAGEIPDESPEAPEADKEAAEEASEVEVHWDGTYELNAVWEIRLQESRLYRLTLPQRTNLILEVAGVPAKITLASLRSGVGRTWTAALTDHPGIYAIREELTLDRGEYSVGLELLREDQPGIVSLCISTGEPAAETPADNAEEDHSGDALVPAEEPVPEIVFEEMAESALQPEDEADPDSAPEAETAGLPVREDEEPAASPTVRVQFSCEGIPQPGTRVVLTAVVSDPEYQGAIRWQFTADGGKTVCDVEGAEGSEYSFLLDEENMSYWWRAYLE